VGYPVGIKLCLIGGVGDDTHGGVVDGEVPPELLPDTVR
jgi:hypothetical protein